MSYDESMLEVYIFENQQLLEKLEDLMLRGEKGSALSKKEIDEVFRIMHTIKGSSSMMSFDNLFRATHCVEDMFSLIRDNGLQFQDWSDIFDIVLNTIDFIKKEFAKIQNGQANDGDPDWLIEQIREHVAAISGREEAPSAQPSAETYPAAVPAAEDATHLPCYKIKLAFEPDCKMENIRAIGIVAALKKLCKKIAHTPEDLDAESACPYIVENGFSVFVRTDENPDRLKQLLNETLFVQSFSILPVDNDNVELPDCLRQRKAASVKQSVKNEAAQASPEVMTKQNFISVNVNKLDSLMDLVGELVTTESMVTRSPTSRGCT
jgi:two-component system chemotaxis sensor kinase CheA